MQKSQWKHPTKVTILSLLNGCHLESMGVAKIATNLLGNKISQLLNKTNLPTHTSISFFANLVTMQLPIQYNWEINFDTHLYKTNICYHYIKLSLDKESAKTKKQHSKPNFHTKLHIKRL